jgi:hypothetical protein
MLNGHSELPSSIGYATCLLHQSSNEVPAHYPGTKKKGAALDHPCFIAALMMTISQAQFWGSLEHFL